jgi:hypothetical protein
MLSCSASPATSGLGATYWREYFRPTTVGIELPAGIRFRKVALEAERGIFGGAGQARRNEQQDCRGGQARQRQEETHG